VWQFIISGYLPGTDLQITFDVLATFAGTVIFVLLILTTLKKHKQVNRELRKIITDLEQQKIREISL